MPLIVAWAAAVVIMVIVRPAPSIPLVLFAACMIAGSVLYILGPGGPWWRGGDGT